MALSLVPKFVTAACGGLLPLDLWSKRVFWPIFDSSFKMCSQYFLAQPTE